MPEAHVTYEVRELLDRMDRKLDDIQRRVGTLERARERQGALAALGGKAWLAAVATLGVIVNIPAMMFYLGGAK